eukprot:CAMPEP_0203804102 /NCGR_PEP_ID=MMETSP0100_2-20121128/13320_1 /ASSEMBLY_ACC=CAM_ASM_000210 /TAXON_ID=96639 /ORGANISM=" , Strain NY0313808BC1" /LENGTH=241 /DNA_ID=CAMNT_0050712127 /DNA_START=598 /DNA_END=1320 /DNA_ORIENTATION=-
MGVLRLIAMSASAWHVVQGNLPTVCGPTCAFNLLELGAAFLFPSTLVQNVYDQRYITGLDFNSDGSSTIYEDAYVKISVSWEVVSTGPTYLDQIKAECKFNDTFGTQPAAIEINGKCRKEDPGPVTVYYSPPSADTVLSCPTSNPPVSSHQEYRLGATCTSMDAVLGMWVNFTVQSNYPQPDCHKVALPPGAKGMCISPTTPTPTTPPATPSPTKSPTARRGNTLCQSECLIQGDPVVTNF